MLVVDQFEIYYDSIVHVKNLRYRIYATDVQQRTLCTQFGSVRWAYNHFLTLQREWCEN